MPNLLRPRFVDLVFASRHPESSRRWLLAAGLAAAAYVALWSVVMLLARPSLASWATDVAMEVHARMDRQRQMNATLEVTPPFKPVTPPSKPMEVPAPPASEPQPKAARTRPIARAPQAAHTALQAAPTIAQAAAVMAPTKDELPATSEQSANTVVSGQAATVTSGLASGQGASKVQPKAGGPQVAAGSAGGAEASLKQPVRLAADDWMCPWPAAADTAPIEEAEVVIRVFVSAESRVLRVEVDKDPGLGFAQAAKVCARESRFNPALGPDGKPTSAWSPRIRVRFIR